MMRYLMGFGFLFSLTSTITGCGVDAASGAGDQVAEERASVVTVPSATDGAIAAVSGDAADIDGTTTSRGLFVLVVARDPRMCPSPLCGGYAVRVLNTGKDQYVSGIDFAKIDPVATRQMANAANGELVVRGQFGPEEPNFHTRQFIASEVYRGMPGVVPSKADAFYTARDRVPPIECFAAPCPNEIASLLNTAKTYPFDKFSVARATQPWVDQVWLTERVQHHGAVVSASLTNGAQYAAGYERILDSSQVFVQLPYFDGPCPPLSQLCKPPQVNVYTRSPDRCLIPDGCAVPGICPMYMPACATGYTLQSWRAQPDACPAYACDPTFTVKY